jgi:hypothetical protein
MQPVRRTNGQLGDLRRGQRSGNEPVMQVNGLDDRRTRFRLGEVVARLPQRLDDPLLKREDQLRGNRHARHH